LHPTLQLEWGPADELEQTPLSLLQPTSAGSDSKNWDKDCKPRTLSISFSSSTELRPPHLREDNRRPGDSIQSWLAHLRSDVVWRSVVSLKKPNALLPAGT